MNQQHKNTLNLKKSERMTLAISAAVIILSFIFIGTPFVTFAWTFLVIVIADVIILVWGVGSETTKRIVLFLSIFAALVAVWYAVTVHFPWLLYLGARK